MQGRIREKSSKQHVRLFVTERARKQATKGQNATSNKTTKQTTKERAEMAVILAQEKNRSKQTIRTFAVREEEINKENAPMQAR